MRPTTWMILPAAAGLALAGPLVSALDEVTGGRVVDPSADRVMLGCLRAIEVCADVFGPNDQGYCFLQGAFFAL